MAHPLNKPKLDNLASDIWKSAGRLRGKFKAYEYQGVILPIIVIRRLECVLIDWRERRAAQVLSNPPKPKPKELTKLGSGNGAASPAMSLSDKNQLATPPGLIVKPKAA